MPKITRVEIFQVDLQPKVARSDAIQTFSLQETPMLRLFCDDGSEGTGYSYTIGNGGSSVIALLRDHLAPRLLGKDAERVEEIWRFLRDDAELRFDYLSNLTAVHWPERPKPFEVVYHLYSIGKRHRSHPAPRQLRKPCWSWRTVRSSGGGASAPSDKPWGRCASTPR